MRCPRCNGRMMLTPNIGEDELTPSCIACGFEQYARPAISHEQIYADLVSERRSMSSAKRPIS